MKINPTAALAGALLTTVLCVAGCGNSDVETQFDQAKNELRVTKEKLATTQEKLRKYQDAEAAAAQKATTNECHIQTVDVLALQKQVLSRLSPTLQIDPILTTAQKNSEGKSFYYPHGWVSLYKKGGEHLSADFYMGTGQNARNKKGQQQWYSMNLELKKDPQDNQLKLFIHQIELSMEGKGQAGFRKFPDYKRGFTAEELMKDPKLATLAPLVQFFASEAVRAGWDEANTFTKLTAARDQAANDSLDVSRFLIHQKL